MTATKKIGVQKASPGEPQPDVFYVTYGNKMHVGPLTKDELAKRFPGIDFRIEGSVKQKHSPEALRKFWRSVLSVSGVSEKNLSIGVEIFMGMEELKEIGHREAIPPTRKIYEILRKGNEKEILELKKAIDRELGKTTP